ncbi:serine protease [Halodesulfovibrio sp.]|jgi:S1-C subfamily serine protease|uniref:S1 family peptidase n=1 Tax=Halodesulfovibrio sp. TaxID=1912772 RepID=UPI0025F11FB3|nr:serine protease [Halodesulfovibrio sp.]MCT4534656.1 serine protease [Halodesulfovibrio sp.]
MHRRYTFLLLFLFSFVLLLSGGCSNRQYVSGDPTYTTKDCIQVLDVNEQEALKIGYTAALEAFDNVTYQPSAQRMRVAYYSDLLGGSRSNIDVVELTSKTDKKNSGFVFDVNTKGKGLNSTLIPNHMAKKFAKELQIYINEKKVLTNVICGFERYNSSNKLHRASGTCWLVDSRGYLVTCEHVAGHKRALKVFLPDGTIVPASVVITDEANDIAILKVDPLPEKYRPIPVALTGMSDIGESIYLLGFPKGDAIGTALKMTDGIISAHLGFKNNTSEYQVDAAINGGNSGGPVLDAHGRAIGMASSKIVDKGTEGLGYIKKSSCLALLFAQVGISPMPSIKEEFTAPEIYSQYRNSVFLIKRN